MKPSNTDTQQVERDIAAGNGEGPSNEQAADLAALEAAARGQVLPGQEVTVQPEQQGPTLQEEIAGLMGMVVAVLSPMLPSLKAIYTEATIGAASGAIGAVCEKHGWLEGGLMGKYGEEIACVAIVGPLAFTTYQGVRVDLAAMEKKKPVDAVVKGDGIDLAAPVPAPAAPASQAGPAVTFGSAPA